MKPLFVVYSWGSSGARLAFRTFCTAMLLLHIVLLQSDCAAGTALSVSGLPACLSIRAIYCSAESLCRLLLLSVARQSGFSVKLYYVCFCNGDHGDFELLLTTRHCSDPSRDQCMSSI